jgi:hypothetical protein
LRYFGIQLGTEKNHENPKSVCLIAWRFEPIKAQSAAALNLLTQDWFQHFEYTALSALSLSPISHIKPLHITDISKSKSFTLRLAGCSQPVRLGVKPLEDHDQTLFLFSIESLW